MLWEAKQVRQKMLSLMYSNHRAYTTRYLVLRCMDIDYCNSIQQYRYIIRVHRARDDLQHFRHCILSVQHVRNYMRFVWEKVHVRGAEMIRYPYVPGGYHDFWLFG